MHSKAARREVLTIRVSYVPYIEQIRQIAYMSKPTSQGVLKVSSEFAE